jgi:hypothetical protein
MVMDNQQLIKLADVYYQGCISLVKLAFVRKLPNGKWRVVSHKGKNLGTYDTEAEAKQRLKQIEYFKHNKVDDSAANDKSEDKKVIDLTDADDFSYSAIMRKLRQKASKEQVMEFLKLFKLHFDKAVKNKLQKPEKIALQNSLIKFNKMHPIKLKKKLVKNAAVSELGAPAEVGKYLANLVKFVLNRLEPSQKVKALDTLRKKFFQANAEELAQKNSPPTAGIGQSITFIKHILFNQDPTYIRAVLNELARNL